MKTFWQHLNTINNKNSYRTRLIPLNLRFFDDEKTEKPTSRKRTKAREEGQVARSMEIGTAITFYIGFTALSIFAGYLYTRVTNIFGIVYQRIGHMEELFTVPSAKQMLVEDFGYILMTGAPIALALVAVGLIANLIQVKWVVTTKPLKPKFSKMNPIKGIKRLFKPEKLVDLLKSILKVIIIGYVLYNILMAEMDHFKLYAVYEIEESIILIASLILKLGTTAGLWYIAIAGIDYGYNRYKHEKGIKMSKKEVKDEYKMSEGDPHVKGKIKSKMREISMRRMMQNIPTADVIITNPTHYAVALSYDRLTAGAPKVVAKGVDHLAKKIKDIGKEHDVQIVENQQLARTLYKVVEIDQEIPPELYQAVAEVLAFVYSIKNPVMQ